MQMARSRHPPQATTEIWGDGDASTGCAPNVDPCTDAADVFHAGDSVVLDNLVDLTNTTAIKYGGGDKIQASLLDLILNFIIVYLILSYNILSCILAISVSFIFCCWKSSLSSGLMSFIENKE